MFALTSTAAAKVWMGANDGKRISAPVTGCRFDAWYSTTLRRTATVHRLRFVADNALGTNPAGCPNPSAGESFLQYIRGRQFSLLSCSALTPLSSRRLTPVLAQRRVFGFYLGTLMDLQIYHPPLQSLAFTPKFRRAFACSGFRHCWTQPTRERSYDQFPGITNRTRSSFLKSLFNNKL